MIAQYKRKCVVCGRGLFTDKKWTSQHGLMATYIKQINNKIHWAHLDCYAYYKLIPWVYNEKIEKDNYCDDN